MLPNFHLSIGVRSVEDSVSFFTNLLKAKVTSSRPIRLTLTIDLFGKPDHFKNNSDINPELSRFSLRSESDLCRISMSLQIIFSKPEENLHTHGTGGLGSWHQDGKKKIVFEMSYRIFR